ncbi:iron ABC transporter permease [Hahella sp. CR1]|uniref:ABC transporter permease n=1 Tax=Hahella sp. CR1 TaxID=2992807 RepID=UPI002441CCED|nr:iron ABC transporter permease [Hahella sp. CR1]MDG9672007.1 iron ABC transporter permease [Hahella sp. CR1]
MEAVSAPVIRELSKHATTGSPDARRWRFFSAIVALIAVIPLLAVIYVAFFPTENIWPHLWSTVLPRYLEATFFLMLGVGLLATFFGVTSAWLVAFYRFPGRKLFSWALLLPFAVPAYVIAYVYTDLLEYSGPVQALLREWFGWRTPRDYWFPQIRSLGGAVIMFSLVLYPYIYLTCRAALMEQSDSLLMASRSLGAGALRTFYRIVLPIIRPALAVGLALVLMETLNDFGTVSFFAVQTLTAGLYDTWLNLGNVGGAAQIAALMVGIALALLYLERASRHKSKSYQSGGRTRPLTPTQLTGKSGFIASAFCFLLVFFGFLVPASVLGYYSIEYFDVTWNSEFFRLAMNSLQLATIAAALLVVVGALLAYSQRIAPSALNKSMARLASVGYAMPGAVLAIGVIVPLGALDNGIDGVARDYFNTSTGLIFSGTIAAIIYAYSARFLAISLGSAESGLGRITPSMDQAARTLGHSSLSILTKVHLPLLSRSMLTAAIIVFVDVLKELPATLILRPFNFETLATYLYQYASDELLEHSALAAMFIVATGIIPVILLNRASTAKQY